MRVAGVDGCPGGWIAAVVELPDGDGGYGGSGAAPGVTWRVVDDGRGLGELADQAAAVGIDIPIGLPSGPAPRAADGAARVRLPGRGSSVFPTPMRAVLGAGSYAEACALSRAVCGRALSKQSWFITPKIAEVDALLRLRPDLVDRLVEAHPEVSFAAMVSAGVADAGWADAGWADAGLTGLPAPPKKTPAGKADRLSRLTPWLGAGVTGLVAAAPRPARADDALDALACAWSALRWALGTAETLGDPAARDSEGLPMRIVV